MKSSFKTLEFLFELWEICRSCHYHLLTFKNKIFCVNSGFDSNRLETLLILRKARFDIIGNPLLCINNRYYYCRIKKQETAHLEKTKLFKYKQFIRKGRKNITNYHMTFILVRRGVFVRVPISSSLSHERRF